MMDKKGGKISLEALDLLRTLETDKKKYVSGTILCSSASVQRVARIVETFGNSFVPYDIDHVPERFGSREIIQFKRQKKGRSLCPLTATQQELQRALDF
jgi:hypothetical protein